MAGTEIENTGIGESDIVNNYQLDLSKLANHGDACIIGYKDNSENNTNSYLYGKGGFSVHPAESGTDYGAIARDKQNGGVIIMEDLSIQTTSGAIMGKNNSYNYSTQGRDINSQGSLYNPVIVLNDNGIIRIIKDEETLNSFLDRYPREEE